MSRLTNCAFVFARPAAPTKFPDAASSLRVSPAFSRESASLGAAFAALVALLVAGAAIAEGFHSNPWLLSWIPPTCCVTNDCCWEITESEVRPVSGDSWEIAFHRASTAALGLVARRPLLSLRMRPHGGKWIKHQGANTRCLFVPMRSVAR